MKRIFPIMLLAALWVLAQSLPAAADQLYVRNKPFKGPTRGAGATMQAELGSLVTALGFTLKEVQGNWVVCEPKAPEPQMDLTGTGKVYFQGKEVAAAPDGVSSMVPVATFASALGAVVKSNPAMGSVDVNMPTAPIVAAVPPKPRAPSEPAAERYTLVAYGADW